MKASIGIPRSGARLPARAIAGMMLLLAPLLGGCSRQSVEIFMGNFIYHGTILSSPDDIEVTSSAIILKPGARFAVRIDNETQWIAEFDVKITSGTGLTAYLRTVPHGFDTTRGIAFRYAADGCSVRTADGTIPISYNAETDLQTLSFYNEAQRLTISAGCRKLYQEESRLPGTEFVIFETLPNSTVELRSVAYFDTNDE